MLDTSVAELAVKEKDSQPTAKAKSKAKAKSTPKQKEGSPEEKAKKELMKDIKAFFGKKHVVYLHHFCCGIHSTYDCFEPRLREKGSKARETALDLTNLNVPHQDVRCQVACATVPYVFSSAFDR